jgi:hypothetical protein
VAKGIKVRELYTLWGFDVDAKPLKEVDKLINQTKKSLGLAKLAIGGTIAAALGAAKFTANAGDAAVKTAQRLGMTTEATQELMYAMRLAGVEGGTMQSSMDFLATTARNAAEGSKESQKALRAVGVSATDAQGRLKPTNVLLEEMSQAFSSMNEEQRKLAPALARGVLGRAGTAMLPLLFQGPGALRALSAEARALGGVLSHKDALAGEQFNDGLFKAWTAIIGIRNEIGNQLIPILGPLVDGFRDWLAGNREIIGSAVGPFLRLLGDFMKAGLVAAMGMAQAVLFLVGPLGMLVDVLRPVVFLLAAFAAGKAILAVVSMAKVIWGVVAAMQALNFQLLMANALTGFVPVLLGLAALGADYAVRGDRSIASSLFGGGAAQAMPLQGVAGVGRSVTHVTEIRPQVNVTVPAVKDPMIQGQMIGQAAHHEMNKMLRQSMQDLTPQSE